MNMVDDINALKARIAHLEENRRYIQNALEMVLSLEDFFADIGGDNCCIESLLPEAKRRIEAIFPFEMMAFYMVDETDAAFQPVHWHPEDQAAVIQQEIDGLVARGHFAWAIRERRGVVIATGDGTRQYLLHVIATHNQIKGMFCGLLPDNQTTLPHTALTLLSIILLHVANAAENIVHTNLLKNQSHLLEAQVADRTRELMHSQQDLEQAIERANAMAKEARAASRAKSDFLTKMSHELRTPLNGIIGMTEVALSMHLDENQRRIVEIIGRESFSLLHHINDVLDFSKIESGKLELEAIDFDLRGLVEEIGESFNLQTLENGIALNVFVAPSVPRTLVGDPVRLRQVLLNLTGNAVKFTEHGEISIEATCAALDDDHATIRFRVHDTGIGIAKDKLPKIFASFTQADNSTTRQYGGTGLGTTISKQLVELMGGTIGVESTPGEGSTFWFEITFSRVPDQAVPAPTDAGLTFLMIGGNPTMVRILADYLDSMGVRAVVADDGDHTRTLLGRDASRGDHVDAILVDEQSIDGNHGGLLEQRRRAPESRVIPVVLISSLKTIVAGGEADLPDVDATLSKPIRFDALQAIVDRVARREPLQKKPPTANPPTEANGHAKTVPAAGNKGNILVVDDYEVNRQVAYLHLEAAGYHVDLAEDGEAAAEAVKQKPYDLILMDVQMPVLNGYDATERIRQWESTQRQGRHTPILALTANAIKGDEATCRAAGMDGYLSKPVHRHQLIKAADQWIGLKDLANKRSSRLSESADAGATPLPSVMDTATAVDEFGDADTVQMVADQLVDNVTVQLATIHAALDEDDRERMRKEAHAIKGGAATMEAGLLSSAAAHLETISPSESQAEIAEAIRELENQFNRFREFLSQWKGS